MIVNKRSNNQLITGLSEKQTEALKDYLTFDNPKYKAAKRYSRSRYITIPPFLEYYTETREGLIVPTGVDIPKLLKQNIKTIDSRVNQTVEYPPFVFDLREDQEIAFKAYINEQANSYPKNLIHLPTGKGKSILAIYVAYYLKQQTLILVHKDDLVVGWSNDINDCFDGKVKPGILKAQKRTLGRQITIATVQTLAKMDQEEIGRYTSQFGLVVQDECHHIGLNIFNTIDSFNSRYKLGLSATPKRTDGLNFTFDLFLGGIGYKHKYTETDDDIMSVKVVKREVPFKYDPFLHKGQIFNLYDFAQEELPKDLQMVSEIPYNKRPVIPYADIDNKVVASTMYKIWVCKDVISHYRKGNSCLLMFQYKEQVRSYYDYLKIFIPEDTIMLYYGDNKEKSDILMQKAERKESLVTLATMAKATEGTNVKSWEVEFLVSSINNEKNVEQAVGRIRRTKPGKINPVVLYDYRCPEVYSFKNHGDTRDKVYRMLKLITDKKVKTSTFSRGYQKR